MLRKQFQRIPRLWRAARHFASDHGGWLRGARVAAGKSYRIWRRQGIGGWTRTTREYVSRTVQQQPVAAIEPEPIWSKEMLAHFGKVSLESLLNFSSRLVLPQHQRPKLSIVLVLFNRCELTLLCLRSLLEQQHVPFELILVDNASSDKTAELLERIDGATVIRNRQNLGFVDGVNQGAQVARGEYLLFLNNDAQVLVNGLQTAITALDDDPTIGALGAKIILPDGALQEAGSIIWRDGSCLGYGRGQWPFAPEFMFQRDVDYCSGAFLMTRRKLFAEMGMFDERYRPAYYEEVDYCVKLHKAGWRVVYHPHVVVLHHEFASSTSPKHAIALQDRNRKTFAAAHGDWLAGQQPPAEENIVPARQRPTDGRRILLIDDRVPHPWLGSGYPRSHEFVRELVRQGHFVTVYPLQFPQEEWSATYRTLPDTVEAVLFKGREGLGEFLRQRQGFYDLLVVSRPHNMKALRETLGREAADVSPPVIFYDAEAVAALRDARRLKLQGHSMSPPQLQLAVRKEIELAERAACVVSVCEHEAAHFRRTGLDCVLTLGHTVQVAPGERRFEQRDKLLFVGAVHSLDSPNADSLTWLAEEIAPALQARSDQLQITVAGTISGDACPTWQHPALVHLGRVDDLPALYDRSRVFLAPTRFAAGVPLKIYEAAAHGVPVVATSLLAEQLGWKPGRELLVADEADEFVEQVLRLYGDPALWNAIRKNALAAVDRDCSADVFAGQVERIIQRSMLSQASCEPRHRKAA